MYFPLGWPKELLCGVSKKGQNERASSMSPEEMKCIVPNRYHMLFALLGKCSISIWHSKPCVEILCYTRPDEQVEEQGSFMSAEWRADSSMLACCTDKGFLLLYLLEQDINGEMGLSLYEHKGLRPSNDSQESVPALRLSLKNVLQMPEGMLSLCCVRDELLVTSKDGLLHFFSWENSETERILSIMDIPFAMDLQQSRGSSLDEARAVKEALFSPYLDGFVVLLSDGRAALVAPTIQEKFNTQNYQGIWAPGLTNSTTAAINNKYRLLAFGTLDGECLVFGVDDVTGALVLSHKMFLDKKHYPGVKVGPISNVVWTPDGCALAMTWESGGLSVFSVFGSCLMCTLGGDYGVTSDGIRKEASLFPSLCWGTEGYQLWLLAVDKENKKGLYHLSFVKSALTSNPNSNNHSHVILQGEDRIFFTPHSEERRGTRNQINSVGSKQWTVIPMPCNYLSGNWPIRFSAVDSKGAFVAIAGNFGFAHYSVASKKWKLFGNIMQERDMVVTGGLTWWEDFICVACYNLQESRDEIRLYPRSTNLDNGYAHIKRLRSQILLANTFRDYLILFCADYKIELFKIESEKKDGVPSARITPLQDILLARYVAYPVLVVSITMTTLHMDWSGRRQHDSKESETLIINVAGRLLILHRSEKEEFSVPPVVLASSVESLWAPPGPRNRHKLHLLDTLWLNCGVAGMRVWLPLFPRNNEKLLQRRIMLPFLSDIYPLAVLFEEAIVLGAANDTVQYPGQHDTINFPFSSLKRTCDIYLHQILRQLLRRNLGQHALALAQTCTELPYFPHVLELMLHEVLEEEATASEPIPDPLLPTIVKFIAEFPEYLQTIVHCARKTEIALWQYLFQSVGNPRDLFEECLDGNKLETAASYLIILQNLEKLTVAREDATRLLNRALQKGRWRLAADLSRFLKAIGDGDQCTPRHPTLMNANIYPVVAPTVKPTVNKTISPYSGHKYGHQNSVDEKNSKRISENFLPRVPSDGKIPAVHPNGSFELKNRTVSNADDLNELEHEQGTPSTPNQRQEGSGSGPNSGKSPDSRPASPETPEIPAEHYYIDTILMRHARKMLEEMKLRDLGQFAAHMGFQLVPFFKKEQGRAAKTEEPVKALQAIHRDFEWPYPTSNSMSKRLLKDLSRSLSLPDNTNATSYQDPVDMLNRKFESMNHRDPLNQYSSLFQQQRNIQFEELSIASLQDVHVLPMGTHDSRSLAGLSEFSEQCDSIEDLSMEGNQLQEQISNLVVDGARGPVRMEMQLRYLLELTLEASCYEWSLLVALVLRDAETIQRLITRSHDQALETMAAVLKAIEKWAALESPGYRVFLLCIRQQNQQLLSRFMQLESLPDLYQPPSHDSREHANRNISKGTASPTLPRATATLPSALRKNSDPFAESRSKMSRSRSAADPNQVGGVGANSVGQGQDMDYAYTDSCSIQ